MTDQPRSLECHLLAYHDYIYPTRVPPSDFHLMVVHNNLYPWCHKPERDEQNIIFRLHQNQFLAPNRIRQLLNLKEPDALG